MIYQTKLCQTLPMFNSKLFGFWRLCLVWDLRIAISWAFATLPAPKSVDFVSIQWHSQVASYVYIYIYICDLYYIYIYYMYLYYILYTIYIYILSIHIHIYIYIYTYMHTYICVFVCCRDLWGLFRSLAWKDIGPSMDHFPLPSDND